VAGATFWPLGLGAGGLAFDGCGEGAGVDCALGVEFSGAAGVCALELGGGFGAFVSAARAENAARLVERTAAPSVLIIANPQIRQETPADLKKFRQKAMRRPYRIMSARALRIESLDMLNQPP
jgi:hypothetical protein